jgi:SAM-dependent methyltransferase
MNELETNHWWFAARREIICTSLTELVELPTSPKILEAGCGTGGNLNMLAEIGEVEAFEFDETARKIAKRKSGMDIPAGALPHELPYSGKTFDLIGLFDVLEHIECDIEALAALSDRLAPNGRIVVTVPAYPWLWSHHDERHHHFRRYTRKSLQQVAKKAGIHIENSFYFNSFLFPLVIMQRLVKTMIRSKTPDDAMPPHWLNTILYRIFRAERYLIGKVRIPLGLSLLAVLYKE